jgi:hypothetical protein
VGGGIAIAVCVSTGTSSLACGYHNPQAMALRGLSWTFPNARHVRKSTISSVIEFGRK